jgi:hypothetical protein
MSAKKKPKIVVTGYARHGKDTVCEMLAKHGWTFKSSSAILCDTVIFPALAPLYGYLDVEQCYEDRVNHRKEWYDLLVAYNTPDAARLGRLIFSQYDIYCGLRNIAELRAMKAEGLVDVVIWVDGFPRKGERESAESITITEKDTDYTVYNDWTVEDLELYELPHLLNFLGTLYDITNNSNKLNPAIH